MRNAIPWVALLFFILTTSLGAQASQTPSSCSQVVSGTGNSLPATFSPDREFINDCLEQARLAHEAGNYAESAGYIRWAAEHTKENSNYDHIRLHLGALYEMGLGLPRSMEKAEELYRSARRKDARQRLSLLFDYETVSVDEWLQAFGAVGKWASSGSRFNQYTLATIYLHGSGIKKNPEQAARWMKLAVEEVNPRAYYLMGVMYGKGLGVEKSDKSSREYLEKAVALGSAEAKEALDSQRLELPDPLSPPPAAEGSLCSKADLKGQKKFLRSGAPAEFEEFRRRFRRDLLSYVANLDQDEGISAGDFKDSIDGGSKGRALVREIDKIQKARRYVPPLWIMVKQLSDSSCPVGYGGEFTDKTGRKLELWYIVFDPEEDQGEERVFNPLRLPAYGKLERNVYTTIVFTRDKENRLMWYALSSEMAKLLQYWYNIQFT